MHLLPQALPAPPRSSAKARGNDGLLFTIVTASERQVAVLRRESGETTILTTGTHGRYLPDGHLIFSRDNSLWIAPFDAEELALTGEPVPLMDGVEHTADQGVHLDVAADGSMAYLPAGDYDAAVRRIAWIDRSGRQAPVGLEARPYVGAAISPDGSRIALAIREQGDTDIWIATPSRQTTTQLTAEPTNETLPVWTPDGKSIVFQSDRAGTDIYKRDAQGAGQADRLTPQQSSALQGPHSMTPDGRVLLFGLRSAIAAVTPPSPDVQTLVSGTAAMLDPRVSSDGRYLAYQSNESGRFEIYVSDYPPRGTRRWRVSTGGGTLPRWAPGSHELFFVDDGGLMTCADCGRSRTGARGSVARVGDARAGRRTRDRLRHRPRRGTVPGHCRETRGIDRADADRGPQLARGAADALQIVAVAAVRSTIRFTSSAISRDRLSSSAPIVPSVHSNEAMRSLISNRPADHASRRRWYSASAVGEPSTIASASSSASRRASVMPWAVSGSLKYPASPTSAHP